MDLLVRFKSAASEKNEMISTTYTNEKLFEVYAQRLFKHSDFDKICAETGQDFLDGQGVESIKNSYCQFWHKGSGHTFWVNCEFRKDYDHKLDWCHPNRLKYLRQFQEDMWPEKVYVIIGFGERPLKPSFMFCIPLDETENCITYPNTIEKYVRNPSQPFEFRNDCLI
jgi:hypothetical protein